MVAFFGEAALLKVSFSIAALLFGIILYILICALGTGQVHKNLKFRTLVIAVVFGTLFAVVDNLLRKSGLFNLSPTVCIFMIMAGYQANVILTYSISRYLAGFFEDEYSSRILFNTINKWIYYSSYIVNICLIIFKLFIYQGPDNPYQMPFYVKIIMGYAYELYYLVYSICLFIQRGKLLKRRARFTAIAALAVTVCGVIAAFINAAFSGPGIQFNYFCAVMGLYIFYIGVETPDYKALIQSMKDLDKAREEAEAANRSKSSFLANMSHEIRTPINAVIGMNEMIIRESSEEAVVGYAKNIESAGKNLLSIINDILDLSKIEAGRMEIVNTEYSLKGLINGVVNMISFKCREKDLKLIVNLDAALPKRLLGDEVRVRQIIINILNNAVKYTNEGSITFTVTGEEQEDILMLDISVKDTGIGIKEEDLKSIFGKFNRVDLENNQSIEGTGLGLAITEGLLEAMDGHIHVESKYGQGTEFRIHLPQVVVESEPVGEYVEGSGETKGEPERYRESFHAPEARILHVDDTKVNHTVMKSLLKKTGIKMDMAMNGPESIELAKNKKYDIILMDYRMPHMDGIEALQTIRNDEEGQNKETPVICLTADAVSGARERYISEGFTDYITKPVDAALLESLLVKYLPPEKVTFTDKE